MDFTNMSDAAVDGLLDAAYAESQRRAALRAAPAAIEQAAAAWREAAGRQDGDPWRPVTGYHDAYPLGAVVTHGGKTWESLTPANSWKPGVSGWRETATGGGTPAWVQPTGVHDAYPIGAIVAHDGRRWRTTVAANVWRPSVYGWTDIGLA